MNKKRKILVIGCSWSRNYKDKGDDRWWSWPELLQHELNEAGYTDVETHNVSHYCSSPEHQWFCLMNELEHRSDNLALIILQFTTSQRQTFINDELSYKKTFNILYNGGAYMTENYQEYFHLDSVSDYDTFEFNGRGFLHINHGTMSYSNASSEFTKAYETNSVYGLGTAGIMSGHFSKLIEEEMIRICERRQIPVIAYKHKPAAHDENNYPHYDFVVERDMPEFKDVIVDNGYHFGYTGNRILIDRFIKPRVIEKLQQDPNV
jgi:hypothetical protein